jgi:hypothetical protein
MEVLSVDLRANACMREFSKCRRVGVEIGVFKGRLSSRLLACDPCLFLYMVDPWAEVTSGSWSETDDALARFTQDQHDNAMKQTIEAVERFKDRHEILRMTSLEAAGRFAAESVDWVFIDGDHSYQGCSADIDAWWPKIRKGGILSGHDYRTDKAGFGVIQAVDEAFKDVRLGLNHTWFVTK